MNTMKPLFHFLMIAALALIGNSCMSMSGSAPAAELQQQLTLNVDSVRVANNKATISVSITASQPSTFTDFMGTGPSLAVKERYDGQMEELQPILMNWSQQRMQSQEKRISLDAGEAQPFSITLQLAEEMPYDRRPIPGMLYLSSNNGISGHLVEPNCAIVMNVVHFLSDNKGLPFTLNAEEDLLVVVVDGRLGVRVMK